MSEDCASFLPPDMIAMLRRKSSRDPNSRFTCKLHMLLTYVSNNPELEDRIGCAWITDTEFKINKKILIGVMGIKENTLNVNLHALQFVQIKFHDGGWTRWSHAGFTRNCMETATRFPTVKSAVTLGMCTPETTEYWLESVRKIWRELFPSIPIEGDVPADAMVHASAMRFKKHEQPDDNAIDVMKAILTPSNQLRITFPQFAKVLGMFGPEESLMLKIANLLRASNESGGWLSFSKVDTVNSGIYGTFSDAEPNCLVIRQEGKAPIRLWNMPLNGVDQMYVVDENRRMYSSWEEYFRINPLILIPTDGNPIAYG